MDYPPCAHDDIVGIVYVVHESHSTSKPLFCEWHARAKVRESSDSRAFEYPLRHNDLTDLSRRLRPLRNVVRPLF